MFKRLDNPARNWVSVTINGQPTQVPEGETVAVAQQKAYSCVDRIHWRNRYFRTDIGYRAIDRERAG